MHLPCIVCMCVYMERLAGVSKGALDVGCVPPLRSLVLQQQPLVDKGRFVMCAHLKADRITSHMTSVFNSFYKHTHTHIHM